MKNSIPFTFSQATRKIELFFLNLPKEREIEKEIFHHLYNASLSYYDDLDREAVIYSALEYIEENGPNPAQVIAILLYPFVFQNKYRNQSTLYPIPFLPRILGNLSEEKKQEFNIMLLPYQVGTEIADLLKLRSLENEPPTLESSIRLNLLHQGD